MRYLYKVFFCCALLAAVQEVAQADKEDKSDEVTNDENIGASELLLELLVKITANPDQWSKVHNLLRQIDQDILTSKQLIEDYQNNTRKIQTILKEVEGPTSKDQKTTPEPMEEKSKKKYSQEEINKEVAMTSDNGQPDINTSLFMNTVVSTTSPKEWPTFGNEDSKVTFVNKDLSSNNPLDHNKLPSPDLSTTKAYPKYFSYHRVTGKPIFINRNPKAYVAVSVVAPKSPETRTDEDLELEHELRQLKPWTHSQNLRNMESIRSRWIIDTSKENKNSEV
ncbi:uncharacterized protein LOC123307665 isoform X2 [Coccinella septempunctata]|uniref:uncharacterized protein LOC123307665 isoform X2 n=1 Tax=Coccinella septempunctata TaxID=41139 RepID=UPI001D07690E|nr:uncharacterized protein LOC123307665 isoform X2 [Coccinella septempunctata]